MIGFGTKHNTKLSSMEFALKGGDKLVDTKDSRM